MKLLICFGTRPEYIKIKPLIEKLSSYKLLHTSQHEDLISSNIRAEYTLRIQQATTNRLNNIISSCLNQFPIDNDCEYVLVQGDTASAFACSLAAFNNKQKIVYLESGLRTYDLENPFPEESYRQIISRIADIHFCPTELSKQNLLKEHIPENKIFVVGNTSLDNLINLKDKVYYGDTVLITLHRRENLANLPNWIEQINRCVENGLGLNDYLWPLHPNPEIQKLKHLIHPRIKIVQPLDHEDLVDVLIQCKFIITDSGGLQEEGSFLDKKSIVCRKNTERPEGIDTGLLFICQEPDNLLEIFQRIDRNPWIKPPFMHRCPYGDGFSSEKILKILEDIQ